MKRCSWQLVLAVLVIGAAVPAWSHAQKPADRGKKETAKQKKRLAPDFELADLDGKKVKLSDFRGKPVFLSFWAYNCPPCRKEAPNVSRLYEKYKEDGLVVLAINHWNESKDLIARYVKKEKLKHRLLMDGAVVGRRLYQVRTIPVYIWIDEEGYIVDSQRGSQSTKALEEKTERLMTGFKERSQ